MAGRIPQSFIDDLISRVDIVDVIDTRVPLKKTGREYQACCPFHDEKTPSFTVSPGKQFYHCFGCGAHGTAIGFLMEYEHMEFVEAVEELARQQGIEVPRSGPATEPEQRQGTTKPLYALLEQAGKYYQHQLRKHPQSAQAIDYLKQRGLSGEIASAFGIGYAPPGWDNLISALGHAKLPQLIEAGLVIENEGKRYDRFRERIMFPIRDRRGKVIGFGGRVLGDGTPKYLNSPETPVFHKGRELYGLYEARQALRELPRLLVVEGYMDVVSLAQFDIRYCVATLGTAVTPEHLELLFRATPEVVFCFDGDRAGREAAWRGLENALPLMRDGRQIRFMFLPDGEDPDTLVRKIGKEAFEVSVSRAMPLSDYLFEQLFQQTDLSRIDGIARLVELARPLLARLPEGIYRRLILESLSQRAHLTADELQKMLKGQAQERTPTAHRGAQRTRPSSQRQGPSPVRHAIALLLQQPELAGIAGDPQRFSGLPLPGARLLTEILDLLQGNPHLSTAALLEHWREQEEGRHLERLASSEMLLDAENANLESEFIETLERLERERKRFRREELLQKALSELSNAEKTELQQLLSQSQNLN
jgi:DNA primase